MLKIYSNIYNDFGLIYPSPQTWIALFKQTIKRISQSSGSDWVLVFQSSITATSMVLIIMNKCATFGHRQSYRDYMEFICAFVV